MKRLLLFGSLIAVVACQSVTDPNYPFTGEAVPSNLVGGYQLTHINGTALPFDEGNGFAITAGWMTIAANDGWMIGDTTSGFVGSSFRWGGVVQNGQTPNAFVFKDSSVGNTRYTATVDGTGTFTLSGAAGRVYRYVRKP